MASVVRINVTPVKGLALHHPDAVELTESGAVDNRRFHLISGGLLFNGKQCGSLVRVVPTVSGDRLTLRFPDGGEVAGTVELGAPVTTDVWGRPVGARLVEGPWSEALSAYAGAAVQLVHTDEPGTGVDVHVGTIVSRASCDRLGEELGAVVDARRFRMLLEVDGTKPHEEDTWRDRRVRAGGAILRILGPVPRCAVTSQDPDTGVVTLSTLRAIRDYRGLRDGKEIDFGVYFTVERQGRVRLGDPVEPV